MTSIKADNDILGADRMSRTRAINPAKRAACQAGICCLALALFLITHPVAAAENWVAKNVYDPFANKAHCVAESVHRRLHDGYQETVIYLQVSAKGLKVVTESNIDPESLDNGIRVDEHERIKPEQISHEQSAVFEKEFNLIVEQFRRGLKVVVTLKFWPTWPDKGSKEAEFSLIGFSQAFARLPNC